MALDPKTLPATAAEYAGRDPRDILALAIREYGRDLAISFSGAEDVVLVDMAAKVGGPFRVFSLDTGRLYPETYQFLEKIREHYRIPVEAFFPQPEAVEKLVREKGLFSFYKDGHKECCGIRKVEPLVRALRPLRAWDTGQRKDQSPDTRAEVPVVQPDLDPGALPHPGRGLLPPARGGGEARAREGPLLLLQGRAQGVLRHPQGRAAGARAPPAQGLGHGPAQGPESRHASRGARRPARPRSGSSTASRSRPSSPSPRRWRSSCARRASSPSTRTGTRSAAASARSSRWCARSARSRPGSRASARTRVPARAPRCPSSSST